MKVELDNVHLAHSELTDNVYVGTINKDGSMWRNKKNITSEFIGCVISSFKNKKVILEGIEGERYELMCRKIK
jgi:hypothetical protein